MDLNPISQRRSPDEFAPTEGPGADAKSKTLGGVWMERYAVPIDISLP